MLFEFNYMPNLLYSFLRHVSHVKAECKAACIYFAAHIHNICLIVEWMEADLNVSLRSVVSKGRGLRGINDWRSLPYITREEVVCRLN